VIGVRRAAAIELDGLPELTVWLVPALATGAEF
jgi:hypothetical protein